MTADRDDLAVILAKHQIIKTGDMGTDLLATTCLCGEQLLNSYAGGAPIERAEWHAAHLAAMVFGSDWLRDVKADAWDEGYEEGQVDEAHDSRGIGLHASAVNPYRADRVDAEDGGR